MVFWGENSPAIENGRTGSIAGCAKFSVDVLDEEADVEDNDDSVRFNGSPQLLFSVLLLEYIELFSL